MIIEFVTDKQIEPDNEFLGASRVVDAAAEVLEDFDASLDSSGKPIMKAFVRDSVIDQSSAISKIGIYII